MSLKAVKYCISILPFSEADLYDKLKKCDDVLCFFLHGKCNTNIGTMCEFHWAKKLGKKLIVVSDFYHPFLAKYADEYYIGINNFTNKITYEKTKI